MEIGDTVIIDTDYPGIEDIGESLEMSLEDGEISRIQWASIADAIEQHRPFTISKFMSTDFVSLNLGEYKDALAVEIQAIKQITP